jgi:hypothetical protein
LEKLTSSFPEFLITNKGVQFSGVVSFEQIHIPGEKDYKLYGLQLGWCNTVRTGICLRKIGPRMFYRDGRFPVHNYAIMSWAINKPESTSSFCIITDPTPEIPFLMAYFRTLTLHIPHNEKLRLTDAVPGRFWVTTDRVFLSAPRNAYEHRSKGHRYPMIIAMAFEALWRRQRIPLVVLSEDTNSGPRGNFRIFRRKQYPQQSELLFGLENREESILPSEFRRLMPDIASLGDYVKVNLSANRIMKISVSLRTGSLGVLSREVNVWDIVFHVSIEKTG